MHLSAGTEAGQPDSDALLLQQFNTLSAADGPYDEESISPFSLSLSWPAWMKGYVGGHSYV